MKEKFKEITNERAAENGVNSRGRKLFAKESTFVLDEGSYKGTITSSFWYRTAEERDRVMLVIQLKDGTEFKNSIDGEWIEEYPFSKLISQANVEYVDDFVGLKVLFEIRNSAGDVVTFSNIRRISLDPDA